MSADDGENEASSEGQRSDAIQDHYPEEVARCYGCGRLNRRGHGLRTFWEGDGTVATFSPEPHHTAIPGYVYGGLLASLVDCHGTGTAAAAAARAAGWVPGERPPPEVARYVTARLDVEYRRPTPLGPELRLVGRIRERGDRKTVVEVSVSAEGETTVEGTVVAVRMPEEMIRRLEAERS